MEKLPRVTAIEVIKVLRKAGFSLARQSGSHKIFKNIAGRRVTVPFHSGKTIHLEVLNYILKDANLSVEEFKKLLK
ncbi:MAG TPA: type II toxin-antitoxin system HicA family toxin [Candidatus Atribacteria bacterium]|nr:type II toxin-antitoxin system HicA family toxin [Candidatus Atribacteria bacterium]